MTDTPQIPNNQEYICNRIHEALLPIILEFPDVKTLAISVGWHGDRNDVAGSHGVWLGRNGPVTQVDEIVVSMYQTLRMFDQQAGRAVEWLKNYRAAVVQNHKEATRGQEEVPDLGTGTTAPPETA